MANKKSTLLLIAFCCAISYTFGQEIASFSSVNNLACGNTVVLDPNLSANGICRGLNINYKAGATYNSRDWGLTSTLSAGDYIEWSITPNMGYSIDLVSLDLSYSKSLQGPTVAEIQVDTGSGFLPVFTDVSVSLTSETNNIDLSSYTSITSTITFRLYAYNATSTNGTFSIDEHTVANKGIIINGSILPACPTTSTWDGSSWSPISPNLSRAAVINGVYNTGTHGSFNACSLTVNSGFRITVDNSTYIEIENNVVVDGQLYVETQGNFVQKNDTGTFTINAGGQSLINKSTSIINNWYDYTYWSSPVANETIGSALFTSDARFWYNAANFEDALAEIGNTGVYVSGQDSFDDNGDAWQVANAPDIMTPGVGYAATHTRTGFNSGISYQYTFSGTFNNGNIQVPVIRNDAVIVDDNYNLIGNPYPSAISVDDFFTTNLYDAITNPTGIIEGAIYLWSHNTPPSSTASGNQGSNFSGSDYAIINGSSEVAGGDNVTPYRYIPSGQGMFIAFSQARPTNTGNVIFNNAMRRADGISNNQFFRSSTRKKPKLDIPNKLWLNLTSNNGVFNQVAVAYLDGASDEDDGSFYDAIRNLSDGNAAIIYTFIKDKKNRKFAIQGKNVKSLNKGENIPLGFYTSINEATIYTLSVAKHQGAFLSNNTIYLKDKLLNKYHDLKNSDYQFTSEVGEFNKRFEIVFNKKESKRKTPNNDLVSIINLGNKAIKFKTPKDLKINTVTIYDALVGKKIHQFKGHSSTEVYNFYSPKSIFYVAKIELSNGEIITKKIILK